MGQEDPWRGKCQPTPVLLLAESPRGRGACGVSPSRVTKKSDTNEATSHIHTHTHIREIGEYWKRFLSYSVFNSSVVILEINSQLGVLRLKPDPPSASLKPSGTVSIFTFLFLCTFLNYSLCTRFCLSVVP